MRPADGHVAIIDTGDGYETPAFSDGRHWMHATGSTPVGVRVIRPLLVIDVEDHAQVHHLATAFARERERINGNAAAMASALQLLLGPPKPPEPVGLGAVVKDAQGRRWTRIDSNDGRPWHCGGSFPTRWAEIAAVDVLSEGITS